MLAVQEIAVVLALLAWGYSLQGIVAALKLLGLIVLFYFVTTLVLAPIGRTALKICTWFDFPKDETKRPTIFELTRPLAALISAAIAYVLVPVVGLNRIFYIVLIAWLAYISFASRRSRKLLGLPNVEAAFFGEQTIYILAIVCYFLLKNN